MGSCGIWGAPMSRSRSAGIASSSVRCEAALAAHPGWGRRWSSPIRQVRSRGLATSRLVGYVVLDQQMMLVREPAREAQLVEQWQRSV